MASSGNKGYPAICLQIETKKHHKFLTALPHLISFFCTHLHCFQLTSYLSRTPKISAHTDFVYTKDTKWRHKGASSEITQFHGTSDMGRPFLCPRFEKHPYPQSPRPACSSYSSRKIYSSMFIWQSSSLRNALLILSTDSIAFLDTNRVYSFRRIIEFFFVFLNSCLCRPKKEFFDKKKLTCFVFLNPGAPDFQFLLPKM